MYNVCIMTLYMYFVELWRYHERLSIHDLLSALTERIFDLLILFSLVSAIRHKQIL